MRVLLSLGLLVLGINTARADTGMLYAGASITHDNLSNVGPQFNPQSPGDLPDISASSWKALIGVRPLRWFAVETDYLGNAGTTSTSFGSAGNRSEVRALAGYAVLMTNLECCENVDLFFKAGIDGYTLTAHYASGGSDKATGAGAALGAGFQWRFGRVGMRIEYEFLPGVATSNGLRVASLGAVVDLL